jgi:hypothetical protein
MSMLTTSTISIVVPQPETKRVLLLPTDRGWVLPYWETTERHFWQTVGHVNHAAQKHFGFDVTTLRCLSTDFKPETSTSARVLLVYEMDNHDVGETPTVGQWMGKDALPSVAGPEQRQLLADWFHEATEGAPPRRAAWARRGWLTTVRTWIDDQLHALGMQRIGPLEQLRTWERGCVLRVPILNGHLYFKALPAMFAHEIPLVQALATHHPGNVVMLLSVDPDRRWMLMADMGVTSLDQVTDPVRWEDALRQFARLQRATAAQPRDILAMGCPDCRIETFADRIDPFFAALPSYPQLAEAEIAQLRDLAPDLKDTCRHLAEFRIPAALEHGDFWPANIMMTAATPVFFDWSDSSLAHPFLSVALFLALADEAGSLPPELGGSMRLRDAYLEEWALQEPAKNLITAFELARQVMPLHLALLYHRSILPRIEAQWELINMVPFYLRKLLS